MLKSDIDIEVLIAVVRSRPVLWDKTSEVYNDREATKEAWDEICTILNENFQTLSEKDKSAFTKEVIKKWTNVRDAFKKFCRREKESEKSGGSVPKKKKYVYHNELKFLRKLFDPENAEAEENYENDDPRIDINKLIPRVRLRTWNQEDNETASEKSGPRTQSYDTGVDTVSDAGDDDSFSAATMSTTSQLSRSVAYKRKRLGKSERKNPKVLDGEKSARHLSFFKGIVPSLEDFNEEEVLKFQMGVLQLISSLNDKKHGVTQTQLPPAQFYSFPSQPGPSAYLPSAVPYPSVPPIYQTFWPVAAPKCNTESTP